jgi:hypothetical protein
MPGNTTPAGGRGLAQLLTLDSPLRRASSSNSMFDTGQSQIDAAMSDTDDKIQEGKDQLDAAKADMDDKIQEGKDQLDAAKADMDDKIQEGKDQLDAALADMDDKIQEGKDRLADAMADLDEKVGKINPSKSSKASNKNKAAEGPSTKQPVVNATPTTYPTPQVQPQGTVTAPPTNQVLNYPVASTPPTPAPGYTPLAAPADVPVRGYYYPPSLGAPPVTAVNGTVIPSNPATGNTDVDVRSALGRPPEPTVVQETPEQIAANIANTLNATQTQLATPEDDASDRLMRYAMGIVPPPTY